MPDKRVVVSDEEAPGWAVRLEAKVDVALAQHGAAIDALARDVSAIRTEAEKVEEKTEAKIEALDGRVGTIERTPTVTPKGLAATIVTTVTGLVAFVTLLDRLTI